MIEAYLLMVSYAKYYVVNLIDDEHVATIINSHDHYHTPPLPHRNLQNQ